MKGLIQRIKEGAYGCLPYLILIGGPAAASVLVLSIAYPGWFSSALAAFRKAGDGFAILGVLRLAGVITVVASTTIGAFWVLDKVQKSKITFFAFLILLAIGVAALTHVE